MEMEDCHEYPKGGINRYVSQYIRGLPELTDKTVLDIPCGDGRASYEFIKKGARVIALDLFPSFMKLEGSKAEYADLSETLPIDSGTVDYVICQEGIEHIPNQMRVLEEFNRVLKKGGRLLITTPNYSHVRARLSHFFVESDYYKRMPPTEIDSVWFADNTSDKLYFGHLFLLNVQHFQTILSTTGFHVVDRIKTDVGRSSLVLGLVLYPLFVFVTLGSWFFSRRKNTHALRRARDRVLWERVKLNISPRTLFCKHIFWVLQKDLELSEMIIKLKNLSKE